MYGRKAKKDPIEIERGDEYSHEERRAALERRLERFTKEDGMEKIIEWNLEQLEHIRLVQEMVHWLTAALVHEAVIHDVSKFKKEQYESFLSCYAGLKSATNGPTEEYHKARNLVGVKAHVEGERHHPEYWDKRGEPMPLLQVILMYFDWMSRTIQRGGSYNEFRDYNLGKLENQPHARVIVECLERDFPQEFFINIRDMVC